MSCWFVVHALLLCGCELCAISAIPGHNQWWILNIFAGWSSCKLCVAFSMWTFEHLDTCAQPGPFQVCMRWYSTNLSWIMTSQCSLSLRIIHLHCSLLKAISSPGSFRGPRHPLQMISYIKTHCTLHQHLYSSQLCASSVNGKAHHGVFILTPLQTFSGLP